MQSLQAIPREISYLSDRTIVIVINAIWNFNDFFSTITTPHKIHSSSYSMSYQEFFVYHGVTKRTVNNLTAACWSDGQKSRRNRLRTYRLWPLMWQCGYYSHSGLVLQTTGGFKGGASGPCSPRELGRQQLPGKVVWRFSRMQENLKY